MEVKFQSNACPCLKKVVSQVQNQEQTQEVRLPESMPDIGNVLGAWGQILIRGKEWRSDEIGVNGGILAWVLYAPEDGSQIRSVETWIPFQMKWDLPQTQHDGAICVLPRLTAVDGRSTSARKLMVRANVSIMAEALELIQPEVCCPGQIPPDVQLLKKSYPSDVPVEAGEKIFSIDEQLAVPADLPKIHKILRYSLTPEVSEYKVMAGRLVFRGMTHLHILYTDSDSQIHTWEQDLPFSQFTELDKDRSVHATADISVILTGAELDMTDDGGLVLKASMAAQYVIYDRVMLEIVEDAYSTCRPVQVQTTPWIGPVRLDTQNECIPIHHTAKADISKIVDFSCLTEHPVCRQNGDVAELVIPSQVQLLYYDEEGCLKTANIRSESVLTFRSDPENALYAYQQGVETPQVSLLADGVDFTADMNVSVAVFSENGLQMVSGLELGEQTQPDCNRPSLILRKAGDGSLWDIAKECGSTVEAICKANQIESEPENGRMLLIPVS